MPMTPEQLARFVSKIDHSKGDCWLWTDRLRSDGYALLSLNGKQQRAHRVAFEHFIGPIPDGKVLDHVICDTRHCVNPWHVAPMTIGQNVMRGTGPAARHAQKVACPHGHPGYVTRADNGRRRCPECDRIRMRRVSARRRKAAA